MIRLFKVTFSILLVLAGGFLVYHARVATHAASGADVLADQGYQPGTVVLTGDKGRIAVAMRLLAAGRTDHVFISGAGEGFTLKDLPQPDSLAGRDLSCCVTLGFGARDTIGNGREVAAWLEDRGDDAAFVVTSDYHMPRALAELVWHRPTAALTIVAVDSGADIRQLVREYGKYLAALIRQRLLQRA